MKLSTAEIRDLFDYKPLTGELVWKVSRGSVRAGSGAGHKTPAGYLYVKVKKQCYLVHRIAWQWVHGMPPEGVVHHKTADKSNRIWDLEDVTHRANTSIERTKKSGLPVGVVRRKARYIAQIRLGTRCQHLGMFDTVEEASAAYQSALKGFSVL